jgi:hypothetical protein
MTYMFDGKQYLGVASGYAILAVGLSGIDQYSNGRTPRTPRHAPALHRSVRSLLARGGL